MEAQGLALEVVAPAAAAAAEAHRRIAVEEQREIGQHAAGGAHVELADDLGIDTAGVALVGHGGVGVPVAEHDASGAQPRADALDNVLVTGGEEEQRLGERRHVALEEAPYGGAERRTVGLAGLLDGIALIAEPARQAEHLGRLPRALDALERDQHSTQGDASRQPRHSSMGAGVLRCPAASAAWLPSSSSSAVRPWTSTAG